MLAALIWLWAPLMSSGVSFIYWRGGLEMPLRARALSSAHGFSIAILYLGALLVHELGVARPGLGNAFWLLLALPISLILISFVRYKGPWTAHLWQAGNMLALAWTFFVGTMAVTGSWL